MKTRKSKEKKASGVLKASRTKRNPLVDKTNDVNSSKSIIKRKSNLKTKSPMVSTTKHNTRSNVKITTKDIKTQDLKVNVVKTRKNQRNKLDLNVTLSKDVSKMPNVSINDIPHRTRRVVDNATKDLNEIPSNDLNRNNTKKETKQQENKRVKPMITNTESTVMPQNNIDGLASKEEPTGKSKRLSNPATNQPKSTFEETPDEKQSDPLDVYEFKYDPKEERKLKAKRRKRLRVNRSTDSSGEEDNTMKPIIRNLRKNVKIKQNQLLEQTIKHNLRNRVVTNAKAATAATTVPNTKQTSKFIDTNINFVSMVPVIEDYVKAKKHDRQVAVAATPSLPITKIDEVKVKVSKDKIKDIPVVKKSDEIIPMNTDEIKNDHLSVADSSAIEVKEIVDTFMDDLDDDDEDSNAIISSPSRLDILSNLIARKSYKPNNQVFNSTMINTPRPAPSSPWRIEMSAIPKKHQYFPVQNKSCTPSYTPDITNLESNKKQTTLLDFMNQTKPENKVPVTLFENPFATISSPRKPFANLSNSPLSPIKQYRSKVSPKKPCIDGEKDDFFGFSLISDTEADLENCPPVKKTLRKRNDVIKCTKNTKESGKNTRIDEELKIEEPSTVISPVLLFEDLLDDKKPNPKRFSRQYTRQQPKRKRIVSFKSVCSGSESDDDATHHHHHQLKKKQKDVITKEEEDEAERLASHYNSMFEEIEHYPLCIE